MKTWEKILLYPIGLCYWIADSAKKTGNFIGRKAKPAIAMLVAVTMMLSLMPMTAFAATTESGKAPMAESNTADDYTLYIKWNTDDKVDSATNNNNIKTAYVLLYFSGPGEISVTSTSGWDRYRITGDSTKGSWLWLYFSPDTLETLNAKAYCVVTTKNLPYEVSLNNGDIANTRKFGGTISCYRGSDYSSNQVGSFQIGWKTSYDTSVLKTTEYQQLASAAIAGDGAYTLPTTTTVVENITATGTTNYGLDAGVERGYHKADESDVANRRRTYRGYITSLSATDVSGNSITGVTPVITDNEATVQISPDIYNNLSDNVGSLDIKVTATMQMVDNKDTPLGNTVSDNTTLTFTRPTQTVSFNTGGGSAVASQTVYYHAKASKPVNDPVWENHIFEGWYENSACTKEFDFSATDIVSDTTIYAKWTEHTHDYTYTVNNENTAQLIESCTCGHTATATLTVRQERHAYTGSAIKPAASLVVDDNWKGRLENVATYSDNVNVGTATIEVTTLGKTISTTFEIVAVDIAGTEITLTPENETYKGDAYEPVISVIWKGAALTEDTDYKVSWDKTGYENADTYTASVVGIGNFTGSVDKTFTVNAADLTNVEVKQVGTLTYNSGEALTPAVSASAVAVNNQPITFVYSTLENRTYGDMPSFANVGEYTVYYKASAPNHNVKYGSFTVTVDKADATYNAPTANDLTYNKNEQNLVSVGTTTGGEMQYALGTNDSNAPTSGWSTFVPQGVNAGTYYVWYKVVGDSNHNDVAPACVAVTIAKTTPTADDFVFTAPSDSVYNGMAKHATIVPKDGIVGMGEITYINYYVDGIQRNDASGVARYTVQIHTAEGDNYTGIDWLKNPDEWNFTISYLKTNDAAVVSGEQGSNGWYVGEVTLNAPEGCEVSKKQYLSGFGTSPLTFNAEQNETITYYLKDVNGYIAEKTIELKIDLTDPTAEYQIGTDGWKKFINTISFGLFCKDYKTVEIKYNDENSGVATKQYYIANAELSEDELKNVQWNDYTETLNLNATGKYFIYIRVVDNAGREVVLNSEGIVVYADSEAVTESISTTYHAEADKDVEVHFNGNTVKEIKNGNTVLDTADYTVDTANGKITLKGAYLDTLNAGTYTFTVSYNPQGVETDKVTLAITTFKVVVDKADSSVTNISDINKTYDGTSVSEPTFDKLGDGAATIEYKVKGAEDSTYTTTAPSSAGDYVVRVTVTEGRNHKAASATAEFSIRRANLTGISVHQNGTLIYNGSSQTPAVIEQGTALNGARVYFKYATTEGGGLGALPTFTEAGSYTVYYQAYTADNNFFDVNGSFTVTVDKATVTEPIIGSKPYTGSAQTANIVDTDLYTVEQNNGGTAQGNYDVVLKLKDADNYKWATTDDEEVTVQFVISAAENSWMTEPSISGWTYVQNANEPVYAAKYGTVKVVYTGKANDGSDYNSETAPTKAGNYTATFTVAGTADYSALSESVNFTIAKATYDMSSAEWDYTSAFMYDGKEHKVEVVGLPAGVTVGGYNGNTATVVGGYTAKVTLTYDANNYNAPSVADLNWKVENNWTPAEYAVNSSGWMNQDFVISAMTGYKISLTDTADGTWSTDLTFIAETADGSVTFYLKDENSGAISLGKTVVYKLDKTAPTGKVEFVDRTGWQEFVNAISFNLFYKDEVTVKITNADNLSGVAKVEYYASNEGFTLNEVKAITDWTEYSDSFGVSVEDTKKFVYYVRITDNAGNVTYLSTDGAEYDITAPVISGIENGATYYTTQKVNVTDKNLDTVTLNGNKVTDTVTLDGNKDVTYTIVATDKAGNTTTATVTMKPISDLSAPIDALNKDNVDGGDEQAVDGVKAAVAAVDTTNATDEEKATLKEIADKSAELEKVIDNTKAEIARIDEELNKHDDATVNSDDAAALEQLAKDITELLDGDNLTETERTALTENAGKVADMQKTIADTTTENKRISDAVDGYDLATVTSDDKADLEQLLSDIEKQLESTNLTEEEISELNGDKKAVEDLLTKIKGTDELIEKLTQDVNEYSDDTVKSTDKDAIEQIIEDIDALLETENLTEDEKKALEDAKDKAEGLLDTIDNADKATDTENTEKVENVTPENVIPENKTDLEGAKADLEKALEDNGGNYTEDEKKAIEDEIKRIDDALEVIGNVEAVEDLIDKLPENITKNDEDAIKAADDAYNALSDYEKSLVDEDAKKALDDAKVALAELNKPADTDSPQTGDNSNMFLWIALLFISGGAVITLTVVDRKKRMASKR